MTRSRPVQKRLYLTKDDRHHTLLDVAATVLEKQGWQALTMISVAEAAKVSRQLVYQHFDSVDDLMTETMSHILRDVYERLRTNINNNPDDISQISLTAENITFDLPKGRARALWQIMTATYSSSAEISRMNRRLRHLLMNLWQPVISKNFGLDGQRSAALSWMLSMSFWGAIHLVDAGEMNREAATNLFNWLLESLQKNAGRGAGTAKRAKTSTATARKRKPERTPPRNRRTRRTTQP